MSIQSDDKRYIAPTYKRFDLALVEGMGALCYDENGKEYIDMTSGIGVNAFGYADPVWAAAVARQAQRMQHASNLYYTAPCVELAKQLCIRTGMKKVFFSNSGAEANECAVKLARKYAAMHHDDGRYTIVTLNKSFHGRTLTTLAATGQESFHQQFLPLTEGFVYCEPNDLTMMRDLMAQYAVAGVLIETVQGEGGVNVLSDDFVRGVEALCREHDALFMVDEVQTGNGRTGKLYSYMHYGVTPDVVTTAKGLAGGLPMGATLMGERSEDVFTFGDHGSTFGGNPVAAAGALTVIDRLDDSFLAEVAKKGDYIRTELETAGCAVSGRGLMIGIMTDRPVGEVIAACMEQGVICLSAKEKLRLLPPLNITWDQLKTAVEIIKQNVR